MIYWYFVFFCLYTFCYCWVSLPGGGVFSLPSGGRPDVIPPPPPLVHVLCVYVCKMQRCTRRTFTSSADRSSTDRSSTDRPSTGR